MSAMTKIFFLCYRQAGEEFERQFILAMDCSRGLDKEFQIDHPTNFRPAVVEPLPEHGIITIKK